MSGDDMALWDIIMGGGVWWVVDDPRSPGHSVALAAETLFKIRTGGTGSQTYVAGRIAGGQWRVEEGAAAGDYPSANAAVAAVHGGTSLDAWLYVVVRHDGVWIEADDFRRRSDTEIDMMQEIRVKLHFRDVRKMPRAKGLPDHRILLAAARMSAPDEEEEGTTS
jgi:hypothetical protein